jgi:hypothetical protein
MLHILREDEVSAPLVARYLCSILLQQLQIPALQPILCSFLEIIFSQVWAAATAAAAAMATNDGKAARGKAAAAAAQRHQQAMSVLHALLPPTAAALVQCMERAAAARTQQQQALLWYSPSKTAVTLAAGGGLRDQPVDLPDTFPAVRLLKVLLRPAQPELLQAVDLLPPFAVLAEQLAQQQKLQQDLTLSRRIEMLADRAASMAQSSRLRSIQAILTQLPQAAESLCLYRPVAADVGMRAALHQQQQQQQEAGSGGLRVAASVAAAAFKLAKLGARLADNALTQLASQLLAIAGPLDTDVITLEVAAGDGAGSNSTNSSNSSSKSNSVVEDSTSLATKVAFPMQAVLKHLAECLFNRHPHVVSVAQSTLSQVLMTAEAAEALQALQAAASASNGMPTAGAAGLTGSAASSLHSCLAAFVNKKDKKEKPWVAADHELAAAAALRAATSAELWHPVNKPFSSWLCKLCSTLLTACGSTAGGGNGRASSSNGSSSVGSVLLQQLAPSAGLSPQLAELLLPHALLHLCGSDHSGADLAGVGSRGLAAQLGSAVTAGLCLSLSSGNAGSKGIDVRCLAMLLSCLEHNRAVHRLAMLGLPGHTAPAAAWRRCYCLHVDYMDVAAAAVTVRAYFTALVYIEEWCQEHCGRLTFKPVVQSSSVNSEALQLQQELQGLLGSSSSSSTGAAATQTAAPQRQQMLEQLLLELYSNINEPDGMYAITAAFGSTASQLQLLKHEGQWAQVLGVQDALLQQTAVQTAAAAAAAAVGAAQQQHRFGARGAAGDSGMAYSS